MFHHQIEQEYEPEPDTPEDSTDEIATDSEASQFTWEDEVRRFAEDISHDVLNIKCNDNSVAQLYEELMYYIEDIAIQSQRLIDTIEYISASLHHLSVCYNVLKNNILPAFGNGEYNLPRKRFRSNVPVSFTILNALKDNIIEY